MVEQIAEQDSALQAQAASSVKSEETKINYNSIGIDLGTTNSAVATIAPKQLLIGRKPATVSNIIENERGDFTTPSAVWF